MQDKAVSFCLTPQKGGGAAAAGSSTPGLTTPSRVLLARGEREMIMLTPDNATQLQQADIEAGKIVSTWKFQKVRGKQWEMLEMWRAMFGSRCVIEAVMVRAVSLTWPLIRRCVVSLHVSLLCLFVLCQIGICGHTCAAHTERGGHPHG